MNVLNFYHKKNRKEKICMLTCYDYTSAKLLANTDIDCVLVGDSAAMVMHGFTHTIPATIEIMTIHTAAVARGAPKKFIVADMPFLSYRGPLNENIKAVRMLMQAGANAIKLEGAGSNLELIKHLIESGVPVMGHLGLTPQSVNTLGGYKVQGTTDKEKEKLLQDAKALEAAGCFSIVLECIPEDIAKKITETLKIPTIGIGAGKDTDGQVLVLHDLLGLSGMNAKFVKAFVNGADLVQQGVEAFVKEVREGSFPSVEHCYQD